MLEDTVHIVSNFPALVLVYKWKLVLYTFDLINTEIKYYKQTCEYEENAMKCNNLIMLIKNAIKQHNGNTSLLDFIFTHMLEELISIT